MRKITPEQQEPAFRINLGEYARILWRKKYFLLAPLAIAIVVSNVGVRFLVPEYESSSVIRVGGTGTTSSAVEQFGDIKRRRDAELGAQVEADILGNAFLDELIHRLGMDKDPQLIEQAEYQRKTLYPGVPSEELVLRKLRNFLRRKLAVKSEGPMMFRISYADANPEACYLIADAVTRLYIDTQRNQTMQILKDVSEFSEEQLAVYKERLDRSERELAHFQEQLAQQSTTANPVTQGNVATAEKTRTDLDLTIRTAEATLDRIRGPITGQFGGVPNGDRIWIDPELRKLTGDLINRREAELLGELSGAGSSSAAVIDESGIFATQQAIQRRLAILVTEKFPNIGVDYRPLLVEYFYQQAEIDALRQKRTRLAGYLRAFRDQVALAPQMETELTRLRQEVERNRTVYNQFKNTQTSTQISEAMQNTELGANITLIEAASRPLTPVRPDKIKILILAFLFGASIGGAGLLLTEFTDTSYRSVDEVERQLGIKVLGTIPRFEKTRWFHDSARKRAVIWSVTVVMFVALSLSAFYFYGKSVREGLIDLDLSNAPPSTTQP